LDKEVIKKAKIKIGRGIAGAVAKTGEPLLLTNKTRETRFLSLMRRKEITSALCVPMRTKGKIIGVLSANRIRREDDFTEDDLTLFSLFAGQAAMAIENARLYEELSHSYISTIKVLATTLDERDPYTHGHSERVAIYAQKIGRKMNLSQKQIELLGIAGLLHDIGKIGIEDAILHKPGSLTPGEYEIVKRHPAKSITILESIDYMADILPLIRHHHERYDGHGYLNGLRGEEIPLGSRILAVADSYEAMTSDRPYRKALTKERAVIELKVGSGTQFDPKVVEAFVALVEEGEI
jgi:HD-GYP domain-containing protein (c-di-GMP phosphodiesterase class II)